MLKGRVWNGQGLSPSRGPRALSQALEESQTRRRMLGCVWTNRNWFTCSPVRFLFFFLLISFHHPSSHALLWGYFVVVSRSYVVRFVVFCLVVFNHHVCFLLPPRAHHTLRLSFIFLLMMVCKKHTSCVHSTVVPARLGARLRKSWRGHQFK